MNVLMLGLEPCAIEATDDEMARMEVKRIDAGLWLLGIMAGLLRSPGGDQRNIGETKRGLSCVKPILRI